MLDGIVRSLWQVERIWYVGLARTPDGGLRTALTFGVRLVSGKRAHEILARCNDSRPECAPSETGER